MSEEEIEPTGTRLEHAIAQTKADIIAIDDKCAKLKKQAEALRVEQTQLRDLLLKLEG